MPKRKKLVIAADVDRALVASALADARFEVAHRPVRSEEELIAVAVDSEILVTRSYNRVTRRVLDAAPQLELIAQGTSGTDNIDAVAACERGIRILSLPGENANAVAEMVVGHMVSLTRTISWYHRDMLRGGWTRDDSATRHELRHYRLGVIGLGEVGRRVARLASAFGVEVHAFDPYLDERVFASRSAHRAPSLDSLLAGTDILTLHVPLTEETRGMIGRSQIAALKRGSFLINAARGEILDTEAALAALTSDHLAGLALDVFDPEPPSRHWPDDPRLILTPHIGGGTHEARASIGARLWEKIVAAYPRSRED